MPVPRAIVPPVFCLVTDRLALQRLHGQTRSAVDLLFEQIDAAVGAGVDLVHVRERDVDARELTRILHECARRAAGTRTRVVVNDRADVACAAGADGVHLRGDSVRAERVRAIAPGLIVGRSVRSAAEAVRVAAEGAVDYLVLGTIFPTPSKPGGETTVGVDELNRAAVGVRVPVLAIGGVTPETLPAIAAAGAAGVAAIRLFQPHAGGFSHLAASMREWRATFDIHRVIS
ncbi:MAG TPA: thiamine phosphate synthase [Vicinamibacterales bacterium]|jgi:thiamine-phosphate diphosphorylase